MALPAEIPLGVPVEPVLVAAARHAIGGILSKVAMAGGIASGLALTHRRGTKKRLATALGLTHRRIDRMRLTGPKEIHYVMNASGGWAVVNTSAALGLIIPLNEIAAGTGPYERLGRNILGKYIEMDMVIAPPTTAASSDMVQVTLVLDKAQNATATSYASIYNEGEATASLGFKNIAQFGNRFRHLKTWRFVVSKGPPDVIKRIYFAYKIPRKYAYIQYFDQTATYPSTNGFMLVFRSLNHTTDSATSAQVNAATRFAFVDV